MVFAERTTSPEVAVPINPKVGRPPAELFIFSLAVRMPDDAGVNVIWKVQVAPAAKCPQYMLRERKTLRKQFRLGKSL